MCVVSSCGGHLAEVRALRPVYEEYEHFYVLNDRVPLRDGMMGRTYFIAHAERDWKTLLNVIEAFRILRKERPRVILSMGAGPAVPFCLVGKLFGARTVFVETLTRVRAPSLTGRIMYWLADVFIYQWESLGPYFPKGIYGGRVV